jgi:hypothetical protein
MKSNGACKRIKKNPREKRSCPPECVDKLTGLNTKKHCPKPIVMLLIFSVYTAFTIWVFREKARGFFFLLHG